MLPEVERDGLVPGVLFYAELEVRFPHITFHISLDKQCGSVVIKGKPSPPKKTIGPVPDSVSGRGDQVILRTSVTQRTPQFFVFGTNGRGDIILTQISGQRDFDRRPRRLDRLDENELVLMRNNHRL